MADDKVSKAPDDGDPPPGGRPRIMRQRQSLTIYIEHVMYERLAARASAAGVSMGHLVRRALAYFLSNGANENGEE